MLLSLIDLCWRIFTILIDVSPPLNNNPHVKRAVFRLPYKDLYFTSPSRGLWKLTTVSNDFLNYPLKGSICSFVDKLSWTMSSLFLDSLYSSPQLLYLSPLCWQKILSLGNVYFHISILVNCSVQLVARNREYPKELNNVLCVIWSCIKMHATHKIVNYASRLML